MAQVAATTPMPQTKLKIDTASAAASSSAGESSLSPDKECSELTPLPSPSMSPAGSTARIFRRFNGQSPPESTQVTRQSSIKRLVQATHQRSVSTGGATAAKKQPVLGELSRDQIDHLNHVRNETLRPAYVRSSSGEVTVQKRLSGQVFEAFDQEMCKSTWREIKLLAEGGFSTVLLACPVERLVKPEFQTHSNRLVAVKLIDMTNIDSTTGHKNARERIEAGLKREIDILQTTSHPSLIKMHAFNVDSSRAVLVLPYCAGGDLLDLVSQHRAQLSSELLRRVFAELVHAVAYLHSQNIVHRDVKLENVLINLSLAKLLSVNVQEVDESITTLTDLGLSRRIDPDSPLLTTRCGSEDYVPPEIIMGQEYDGRESDAWALGVSLFALLEGRLPFDPLSGHLKGRRAAHRIARVEWKWSRMLDEDVDPILKPAMQVVEGLLQKKQDRWSMAQVLESEWVSGVVPDLVDDPKANDWADIFI